MRIILLLIFYVSFICQSHEADMKKNLMGNEIENMMGSTAMTYDLSKEDISELKYKSQHGNAESSFRLYQYYCFTINDIDEQLRYLGISAFQGNVIAQYNYGIFLSDRNPAFSKYYDLDKAIYWIELAVKNGATDAKNKLQELKKLKGQK